METLMQIAVGVSPAARRADALPLHPLRVFPGEGTCLAGLLSFKVRRR